MRDPKAIRKAIMTAKSVARLIDPNFGRVPLPDLGRFGADEPVQEHSPMIHEIYGEPMPQHFAAGGDVYGGHHVLSHMHDVHHEAGMNKPLEEHILGRKWKLKTIHPDDIPDIDHDVYFNDPFDRVVDFDEDQIRRYKHLLAAGREIAPIIKSGDAILDGNHRAQAAKELGLPIQAYVPHDEPEHYAAGGGVGDENPYSQPDENGFYSHAAATAAELPQQTMSPDDMRQALLGRGVKNSELKWGEYDYAFGDDPKVDRDEVAKHLHIMTPPIEEKTFRYRQDNEPDLKQLRDRHAKEMENLWDEMEAAGDDPKTINARRRELRDRHRQEIRHAWHGNPHHANIALPGGENYREILLKHANGDMFPGVPVHFGGEPDVFASLMVKDRQDEEGDKVLHLDELQSDWAQKARKHGFNDPVNSERVAKAKAAIEGVYDKLTNMEVDRIMRETESLPEEERGGISRDKVLPVISRLVRRHPEAYINQYNLADEWDAADREHGAALDAAASTSNIERAPYVEKTEDWVDLGLKRALREAAEKGYDKLAWSPGSLISDRYNLAKHVNSISHEKNDDGTYNLSIADPEGGTFFQQRNMSPEKVASYLGKGVAEKVFAGEGLTNEDIADRDRAARKAHLDFLDRLAEQDVNDRIKSIREEFPDKEYSPEEQEMMRDIVLQGVHRDPAHHAKRYGLEDEHQAILDEMKAAADDYYGLDRSRNYRHLKTDSLEVGEKWPIDMYDRMIPKRALRLAKMHDPEAQLTKSRIEHPSGSYGKVQAGPKDLHAIRITPKMRESILKKGFPAYAQGGEVDGYADGGEVNDDAPKKTIKAYKLFKTKKKHPGKLFPLFVNSDQPVEVGKWLKAEAGPQGKTEGRVKSSLGDLAYRPGWHSGDLPIATHIGGKSSPDLKAPDYRPEDQVWAEVEHPADVDWQSVADSRARKTKAGKVIPNTAHITDQVPHGGHYRYKTNPNMTGNWIISGDMKVNRILSDDEVKAINDEHGVADLPRRDGFAGGGRTNMRDLLHMTKLLHAIGAPDFMGQSVNPDKFKKSLEMARQALASPIVTRGMDVVSRRPKAANVALSDYGKPISEMSYKTISKGLLLPWKEADLERMQMENASIVPMLGDLSAADRVLLEINGKKLEKPSEQQGGGDFMRSEFSHGPDAAAYGNREGAAKDIAKKVLQQAEKGRPVIGTHVAMGVKSVDSSHHAYEPLLRMINVSDIAEDDIKAFDAAVRKMLPATKQFPEEWPGVRNTAKAERFFANRPGTHASDFVKLMDRAPWQKAGFPDVGAIRFAASVPELLSAPRMSSGYAFSELDPSGEVILSPELSHRTYPVLLPKKGEGYRGGTTHPVPMRLMFPDFYKGLKQYDKNNNPIDYESPVGATMAMRTMQTRVPVQRATQEWLDNIMEDRARQEEGYKKGGAVRKALMIAKGVKKK